MNRTAKSNLPFNIYRDEKNITINFKLSSEQEGFHKYLIPLEKIQSGYDLDQWLAHLYTKSWVSDELIRKLIFVVNDYFREIKDCIIDDLIEAEFGKL